MKPIRVQRKRVKGWKMPKNTVSVTRPGKWGNPFKEMLWGDTKETLVERFLKNMSDSFKASVKKELKGKNLACFCKIGEPCHADVLLKIANS